MDRLTKLAFIKYPKLPGECCGTKHKKDYDRALHVARLIQLMQAMTDEEREIQIANWENEEKPTP